MIPTSRLGVKVVRSTQRYRETGGNKSMQRRDILKTVGGIGAASAVGGAGLVAMSGVGVAADTELEGPDEAVTATTDDGEIQYVAYGGRLRFEWDGLDEDAQYGGYGVRFRLYNNGSWESWVNLGEQSGELGGSWGGDNDYTQATGTDGVFQFKYGSPHGQRDYAIAYNDDVANNPGDYDDILPVDGDPSTEALDSAVSVDKFYADEDGGDDRTVVEVEKTCTVYDGDPNDGGSKLVEDSDRARFEVIIDNRPAEGTTGGEVEGAVGADES